MRYRRQGEPRVQLQQHRLRHHSRSTHRTDARAGGVVNRHQRAFPTETRRRHVQFRGLVQRRQRLRSLYFQPQQLICGGTRPARLWPSERRTASDACNDRHRLRLYQRTESPGIRHLDARTTDANGQSRRPVGVSARPEISRLLRQNHGSGGEDEGPRREPELHSRTGRTRLHATSLPKN